MKSAAYPPAPWRLTGRAYVNLQLVPTREVHDVPSSVQVVQVLPRRTLGGLYLARYDTESTLTYSELIVFSALVRRGRRFGGWVSHIYVDAVESVAGGREIWGLPKDFASFEWGERVTVRSGGIEILCAAIADSGFRIPIKAPLPAFGIRNGTLMHFTGKCRGKVGASRTRFEIPPESPFSSLRLGRGWSFALSSLDAWIPAPVAVSHVERPLEG